MSPGLAVDDSLDDRLWQLEPGGYQRGPEARAAEAYYFKSLERCDRCAAVTVTARHSFGAKPCATTIATGEKVRHAMRPMALSRLFQADSNGVERVSAGGRVLKVGRRVMQLVAILVVYLVAGRSLAQEGKRYEGVNVLSAALAIPAERDMPISLHAEAANQQAPVVRSAYPAKRRHQVQIGIFNNWTPFLRFAHDINGLTDRCHRGFLRDA